MHVKQQLSPEAQLMKKVSLRTVVVNFLLVVFKLLAGLLGRSGAMTADAIHSASDMLGGLLVLFGAGLSGKAADEEHPYGHERMECIISIVLANLLLVTGLGIGWNSVKAITAGTAPATPGVIALAAAVVSIVTKEALFWYTKRNADQINSVALRAEAWHHRSDALSSVGSFAGILGARMGLPVLDPIAGLIICLLILKVAVDIYRETIDKLVDHAADEQTLADIRGTVARQQGVLRVDDIKTRLFGARIYVDIEIGADESLTLREAHSVAERVHDAVEHSLESVKHCTVHVNPVAARERQQTPCELA